MIRSEQPENKYIPDCIFKQNFCYSVSQLVNAKRVTSGRNIPQDFLVQWDAFRSRHRSIVYDVTLEPGASQCLNEACKELATSYLNIFVETFEKRVLRYLHYRFQTKFKSVHPEIIRKIAKDYSYQSICFGEPRWPTDMNLPENTKENTLREVVDKECRKLRSMIGQRVTLASLSTTPTMVYRCLAHVLRKYEKDHALHKPYDVRRLPIPRLFSPSIRWRSVTISTNALACFVRSSLPRGYLKQLELFYEVFNFKSLGY